MAEGRPSTGLRPRWSRVLRALREARGVTQEGWAALLRVGVNTVGRWESGTAVPNAQAEHELLAVCQERGLFRAYAEGPLRGTTLTPELLSELLAEARLTSGPRVRAPALPDGLEPGPVAPAAPERLQAGAGPAAWATPGISIHPGTPAQPGISIQPGPSAHPGIAQAAVLHRSPPLPIPPTPLVGRAEDAALLTARLCDPASRLVTLTGMGGVGKTRLALQVAADLLPEHAPDSPFQHGVAFVPLTAVVAHGPVDDLLATAIATTIGFALSGRGSPVAEIVQFLREKSLLLVLDDVEHVAGLGPFVSMLVQEAPSLTILATSRERLNVRGEWVVDLAGLAVPPDSFAIAATVPTGDPTHGPASGQASSAHATTVQADSAAGAAGLARFGAIELFVRLARALAPELALDEVNGPAIRRICRLVAGLPLGIELAAGWVRMLTCDDIAAEIERSLDFLSGSLRDLPERHRSLRAVCTSSWQRLSPEEQATLRQLAIFRGSFTREAAAAVAGADLPRLAALVDRSLVQRVPGAGPAQPGHARSVRYELLQPVRQFAAEHLEQAGETALATARHAHYFLGFLESHLADLRGPRQREALDAIEAEIAQVRAAWQWAIRHAEPSDIGRAADSLFHFYDIRSWFREGAAAFQAAAQALAAAPPLRTVAYGKLLARHGWFTFHLGHQHEAKTLLERSLATLRPVAERSPDAQAELIFPLNYLAAVESYLGNTGLTNDLCQEALALAERLDDRYGQAIACNILGQTAYQRGEYRAARTWSERSLAIERQLGNRWSMAYSLTTLGRVAYATGAYAEARRLVRDCLRVREELGDVRGVALCLSQLGSTALALGDRADAADAFARSYALSREIGNPWGMTAALIDLATVAASAQRDDLAARILHEALRLALASGVAPHVAAVCTACAPLARRAGQPDWAAELQRLGAAEGDDLEPYREPAARLLAWTEAMWSGVLTVEQAIEAVQGPAPSAPAPSEPSAR
jgi:predicted ATPase/transcriptional regulator with XRE-family HTH domain